MDLRGWGPPGRFHNQEFKIRGIFEMAAWGASGDPLNRPDRPPASSDPPGLPGSVTGPPEVGVPTLNACPKCFRAHVRPSRACMLARDRAFRLWGLPAGSGRRLDLWQACMALRASRGPRVGIPTSGGPATLPGKPGGSLEAGGSIGAVQGIASGAPGGHFKNSPYFKFLTMKLDPASQIQLDNLS